MNFGLLLIWIDKKIECREESESLGSRISRRSSISEVVLDVVVTSTQSQSAGSKLQRLLGLANLKDPRSSQFTQLIFCPSIARRQAALGRFVIFYHGRLLSDWQVRRHLSTLSLLLASKNTLAC